MPQIFMDYWAIFVGLVAVIGVLIAWRQLKASPKGPDKNVDVDVNRSKKVGVLASEKAKANVDVSRSEEVEVKIGGNDG